MRALHDGHGRSVRYLRLSVTDRCNLRCLYCRSNARQRCIPHAQVLRYEEMARMVGIAAALGIGKVRLTGGDQAAMAYIPHARRPATPAQLWTALTAELSYRL